MNNPTLSVLILDRDPAAGQLLVSTLSALGAGVKTRLTATKAEAMTAIESGRVDVVIVDPSPSTDIHGLVLSLRQKIPTESYIIVLDGEGGTDRSKTGANDVIPKPIRRDDVAQCLQNARGLLALGRRLNDTSEDFPSKGGVIAKSAFAQLYASAMDRADRYAERSHILFIRLMNLDQIRITTDDYTATTASAALAREISRLRRQSDILAQTGKDEYALMLQRPAYESEPIEAALRFADALTHSAGLETASKTPIALRILMIELPTGMVAADHSVDVKG